jgi:hypothetical protein
MFIVKVEWVESGTCAEDNESYTLKSKRGKLGRVVRIGDGEEWAVLHAGTLIVPNESFGTLGEAKNWVEDQYNIDTLIKVS